jgi:Uma2 family endonuclease
MSALADRPPRPPLRGEHPDYPIPEGPPLAEGDEQLRWIVTLHGNLEFLYANDRTVQVSADHAIYPVQGQPKVWRAPDVFVAFGVPKQDRACYLVWQENNVFPQVIIEVRSKSNTPDELADRLAFYERHGAEECYDFDPKDNKLQVYLKRDNKLVEQDYGRVFVSPLMGVRFDLSGTVMRVYTPDDKPFLTRHELQEWYEETSRRLQVARQQAAAARDQAEAAHRQAEAAHQQAAAAHRQAAASAAEAARLRELLRQAGIDPDAPR